MKKILIVFGTRPEAIKMAPLVKEFENHRDSFSIKVCVTAQHREMLDQVLSIFEIVPDYDLNIMKSGQTLYNISIDILSGLQSIFTEFKPDLVFSTWGYFYNKCNFFSRLLPKNKNWSY